MMFRCVSGALCEGQFKAVENYVPFLYVRDHHPLLYVLLILYVLESNLSHLLLPWHI